MTTSQLLIERSGAGLRIIIPVEKWTPSFLFLSAFALAPVAGAAVLYRLWSGGIQEGSAAGWSTRSSGC